jgi:hypothetical protein
MGILLNLRSIADIEYYNKNTKGNAGRMNNKALGIIIIKVIEKDSQLKGAFGLRYPEC